MTSKFSIDNKELLQRISSGEAVVGIDFGNLIVRELAAFRLAAMDSRESIEMPLDYLQGHKDGLEWAARLAEANHPDTGDWLYDDPIELAKAIRKGPDMPPAQSVADSEPVIVVGDDGGDALSYRRLIQSFEPGTKLYRHAQPVPRVPDEKDKTVDADDHPLLWSFNEGWNACRAAMLHAQSDDDGEPTDDERIMTIEGIHNCERCGDEGWVVGEMGITRCACGRAGNSPVIPDGYVMVPKVATEKMLIAGLEEADPLGSLIDWDASRGDCNTREQVQGMFEAMLAAAPQLPGSEPATVPGKWIPVSERMPEDRTQVILWDAEIGEVTSGHYSHKTQTFYHCGDAIENEITHWMLPPSAPQGVKP